MEEHRIVLNTGYVSDGIVLDFYILFLCIF